MYDFFLKVLPSRAGALGSSIIGALGMVITYLFGGWTSALEALMVAMAIDYATGIMAAYINPGMMLDSRTGFRGICKKIMILLLVSIAHFIDAATGQSIICAAIVWFFLGNEGLSILENAAKAGVPIPDRLRQTLQQLSTEKTERKDDVK